MDPRTQQPHRADTITEKRKKRHINQELMKNYGKLHAARTKNVTITIHTSIKCTRKSTSWEHFFWNSQSKLENRKRENKYYGTHCTLLKKIDTNGQWEKNACGLIHFILLVYLFHNNPTLCLAKMHFYVFKCIARWLAFYNVRDVNSEKS